MNGLSHPTQNIGNGAPHSLAVKYLTAMFWLGLATLIVTLITWLPIPDGWAAWVKRAFNMGTILCLFLLTPVNLRYRKSAFFRAANFCCAILNLFISSSLFSLFVGLIALLLSIAACWQLYRAHAELISAHSEKLARNWRWLFWCELVLSIIATAISAASYILISVLPQAAFTILSVFSATASWIIVILNTILTFISLIFLFLTVKLLKQQS